MKSMYYIYWNGSYGLHVVDEADTLDEAKRLCDEYEMAYGGEVYWGKNKF